MTSDESLYHSIRKPDNFSGKRVILKNIAANMENIAGPSNASSAVFATHTISASSTGTSSYYSNIEPDFKWMKSSIKYLIELVANHFDEFYDKTVKKKILWKKIAEEMKAAGFKCTSDECDKKWRNIKKTYISVLQKQVQGDFSSKFAYFDEMHSFLGKEIDPLGMREQGLNKAAIQLNVSSNVQFPRAPFVEYTEDDNFHWSDSAAHMLIDTILDHEKIFRINSDIDNVWESIQRKMNSEGYDVASAQCQRKWRNLADGFRYHQSEAEITGILPKWSYFTRVRRVIHTFNVPTTVAAENYSTTHTLKGTLTTPLIMRESPHKKRKRKREFLEKPPHESEENDDDEYDLNDASRHFQISLRRLHETLKADDRLSHLEARIEVAHKARAETKQSITLLENILSKLRHINKSFEIRKQLLRDQEEAEAEAERFRNEGLILNPMEDSTCRQPAAAFLNMNMNVDFSNLGFLKTPKVEMVEGNDENIFIVNG